VRSKDLLMNDELEQFFNSNNRSRINKEKYGENGSREGLSFAHEAMRSVKLTKSTSKGRTFVHFGNEDWNLVLHMLFGIRQSVHSVMHEEVY